jgi:hypothetical protein
VKWILLKLDCRCGNGTEVAQDTVQ